MATQKAFIEVLKGKRKDPVPFWFMRQAGRYLPEYRELRAKATNFLEMVYTPEMATEITLQPIRRYGMDAAILFADILVVPDALGQKVDFVEKRGPVLDAIGDAKGLARLKLDNLHQHLAPVYETIGRLTAELPEETALIGFAGAPWTVATYMVEGGGSPDQAAAKTWAYTDPKGFGALIDLLVEATSAYLVAQAEAGAEALQIFDTWAGSLPESAFSRWVIAPTAEIVRRIRVSHPQIPIIGFPRGAGPLCVDYVEKTGIDGISIDQNLPAGWAARHLQPRCAVQGNLDPRLLVVGGEAMVEETRRILKALSGGPHIFNLGHGIVPEVPPENVALLRDVIRGWRSDDG